MGKFDYVPGIDMRLPNKAVITDGYAIPRIKELHYLMKGCSVYSKINLSEAYLQLKLHEDSRDLKTFVTNEGLFKYKRCLGAFQSVMTKILAGIRGVCCYLDDILIGGSSSEIQDWKK